MINLKEKILRLSLPIKLLLFGLGSLVATILIIIGKQQIVQSPTTSQPIQNKSASQQTQQSIQQAPKVTFATYENTTGFPALPENFNVYTFKTSFSSQEIQSLQTRLGLRQKKLLGRLVLFSSEKTEKDKAFFLFDPQNGSWYYQSLAPVKPTISGQPPIQHAEAFLQQLGSFDVTISCPIIYDDPKFPDHTLVECHRDWQKVGLPILSSIGTVALSENQRLAHLELGKAYTTVFADRSGAAKSLAHPIDFNSATIAVGVDGNIRFALSNIRPIASVQQLNQDALISPQEALEEFQKHKSSLSMTVPAGYGLVDRKKVYPDGTATSPLATISDYVLVYLENPPQIDQEHLIPMYLIRGTAQLTSGYRVNFTETVPAVRGGAVAGESTLKLGTFDLSITPVQPSPLPTPTTFATSLPSSTIQPSIGPTVNPILLPKETNTVLCNPDFSSLKNITQTSFFGKSATIGDGAPDPTKPLTGTDIPGLYLVPDWYTRGASEPTLDELSALITEYGGGSLPDVTVLGDQDDPIENIQNENNDTVERKDDGPRYYPLSPAEILAQLYATHARCPVQISIVSPTLFVYLKNNQSVAITPDFPLTYTDPPVNKNLSWTVYNDGGNSQPPYLYYEYPKQTFQKPNDGWIVEKSELANFVTHTLSPQLALVPQETDRLIFELHHAAFDIDSEFLLISPIDQKEVDEKLPLIVFPTPESITRIHFLVSKAIASQKSQQPHLKPVGRKNFMLLELGASKL